MIQYQHIEHAVDDTKRKENALVLRKTMPKDGICRGTRRESIRSLSRKLITIVARPKEQKEEESSRHEDAKHVPVERHCHRFQRICTQEVVRGKDELKEQTTMCQGDAHIISTDNST